MKCATPVQTPRSFARAAARACLRSLALLVVVCAAAATARAQLSITPTTWNIIGLDSNRVTDGPDTFQTGVRVCNTGATTLDNIRSEFFWETANAFINLSGQNVIMWRSLAPAQCVDFYFPVIVTRTSAAYFTTRRYYITASADGTPTFSTPRPRELYVEKLLSQNRNDVEQIIGPTTVYVGQTYNYTINAQTATGYAQLESFLNLSNVTYQVLAVSATYETPAGATHDKFYADACGWQTNPTLPNYRSCTGPANFPGGKVGGRISTTYTVKILGAVGTVVAGSLILDFSGGSFHYASGPTLNITVLPSPLTLAKTVSAPTAQIGTEVTYTLRATNAGADNYTLTEFLDTLPTSPATPAYVAGSSAYNGAAIPDPVQTGNRLNWRGSFGVPAGQTRDLTFRVLMPTTAGNYVNSAVAFIDFTQVDTTPAPGDNAPAQAPVAVVPPPSVGLVKSCAAPADCTAEQGQPPGTDLTFQIAFANTGGVPARNFVITDPVPVNTDFKVGSAAASLGSTGLAVAFAYSNDNGASFAYTPASGAGGAPAGYDRAVTHVRWVFTGNLSQAAPNNAGSVQFVTRIR